MNKEKLGRKGVERLWSRVNALVGSIKAKDIGAFPITGGSIKGKLSVDVDADGANPQLRVAQNQVDIMKTDSDESGSNYPMISAKGDYNTGEISIRAASYKNRAKNIDIDTDGGYIDVHDVNISGSSYNIGSRGKLSIGNSSSNNEGYAPSKIIFTQQSIKIGGEPDISDADYPHGKSNVIIRLDDVSKQMRLHGPDIKIGIKNAYAFTMQHYYHSVYGEFVLTKIRGGHVGDDFANLELVAIMGANPKSLANLWADIITLNNPSNPYGSGLVLENGELFLNGKNFNEFVSSDTIEIKDGESAPIYASHARGKIAFINSDPSATCPSYNLDLNNIHTGGLVHIKVLQFEAVEGGRPDIYMRSNFGDVELYVDYLILSSDVNNASVSFGGHNGKVYIGKKIGDFEVCSAPGVTVYGG